MKLKSKTVKYPTESALDNQILESILPTFITRAPYKQAPLPKSREFYRSEEFIWNNPYRASKKTFRYFHQTNKDNETRVEELKRSQMTEREHIEQQRISCIRDLRHQELQRLEQRKQRRRQLEQVSGQKHYPSKLLRAESLDGRAAHSPAKRDKSEAPELTNRRLIELQQTFQREQDNQQKIFELIRSETLKNRDLQCDKLRKRHQRNLHLMEKSGLKTQSQWNWATIRVNYQSGELLN